MPEDESYVRVTHRVLEGARDQAQRNAEHGEMSELVRKVYDKKAFGSSELDRDQIDERLRELRGNRDEKRLKLRRLTEEYEADIRELEVEIARLEERKDKAESKSDKFEGAIDQLVARVKNQERVFPELPGVQSAARTIGEPPEFVVDKVRQEVPDAPDELFEQGDVNNGGGLW